MLTQKYILSAHSRIQQYVRRTPTIALPEGDLLPNTPVVLKLEQLQHTASFKARGAFNAMLSMDVPKSGVIAASGGNHGAAVAYVARQLGHRAEIFVPEIIAPAKLARLESYGATVHVGGREFADALAACQSRQQETGALLLHAYDQVEILAGQGTVAVEFEDQAPNLDTVLVAVGGGGLIGGIASWYQGRTRVIAVESTGTPTLYTAWEKGEPAEVQVSGLAADALGARRVGDLGFAAAQAYVDHCLLVSDEQIGAAQQQMWEQFRVVLEPGGATAIAALTSGMYEPADGETVGVLLCGGNTDPSTVTGNSP
jgi:threonine dehydratase